MTKETDSRAPTFQKTTLDNGLRVVSCEMPYTASVSIGIVIGVGSRYESAEQAGISHFIEHLVFKGTQRRPTPLEISETIEGTGGVLNAGTEQELTVYWCKVARTHFNDSLDLLVDMLRGSLFRQEDIERERQVVIEELKMINDYPGQKVDSLIDEMLWPGHPLGRDIGGTADSISGITRDMMLEHMSHFYNPSNIVVSVAGNVPHQEIVDQVEARAKGWPPSNRLDWEPFHHTQMEPQLRLEYRKTEQTHLSIALPGVSLEHPQRYALDLLSVILGEGMSSRLFVAVREESGLAYDVHSGVSHFMDCGALIIAAGVDHRRVYEAVQMILAQVSGMRERASERELDKAKGLVVGRLQLRMEDTRAVCSWMGNQETLIGRINDPQEVLEGFNSVSAEDIQQAAQELLVSDRLNMAVVGPVRGEKRLNRLLRLE